MTETTALWPWVLYSGLVIVVVAGMIVLSYLLGQRHHQKQTGEPYESGIVSTGSAWLRQSVPFYLIATFFVIFDLETVFLVAWAVSLRQVGWAGYVEGLIFVGVLVIALIYLWKLGALDWGPRLRKE